MEYNSYSLPTKKEYYKEIAKGIKIQEVYSYSGPLLAQSSIYEVKNGVGSRQQTTLYEYSGNFLTRERQWIDGYLESTRQVMPIAASYRNITYTYDTTPYSMQPATKTITGVADADGTLVPSPYGAGVFRESFAYDWFGRIIAKTDPKGNQTRFERDALGRVTKEIYPGGDNKTTAYDDTNNHIRITDEEGHAKRYEYTPLGQLSKVVHVGNNAVLSSRAYDNCARLSWEKDHKYDGVTSYTYDPMDRIIKKRIQGKSVDHVEKYIYDDAVEGKYTKETKRALGDCRDYREWNGFTPPSMGWAGEADEAWTSPLITTVYKDVLGNAVREGFVLDDQEYYDAYTYDNLGNKRTLRTAQDRKDGYDSTDSMVWEYDGLGKVKSETNALGQTTYSFHDGLGRKLTSTDYSGRTSSYTYDILGRLILQATPFSADGNAKTKFYYDMAGNATGRKVLRNAPGEPERWTETTNQYDARGRLLSSLSIGDDDWEYIPANYLLAEYGYDRVGNRISMEVGRPFLVSHHYHPCVTTYAYDSFGNILSLTDPMGQVERYIYNATGCLVIKTDRNGNKTIFGFDGMGRVLSESVTTPTGETLDKYYDYTREGLLKKQSNGSLDITCGYDLLGRLTSQTETGGVVKTYAYNLRGDRTGFILKKNDAEIHNLTYIYDRLGRMTSVKEKGVELARYTYDTNGNRQTLAYPQTGVTVTYGYNHANLVESLENKRNGAVVSKFSYAYYLDGNQRTKTDHTGKKTTYTYDGLGRLTGESETGGNSITYQYDSFGNRSRMETAEGNPVITDYSYDRCNRLIQEEKTRGDGSEEILRYEYDGNGNQIQRMREVFTPASGTPGRVKFVTARNATASYEARTYNGFNELVSVYADGMQARYTYRPDGLYAGTTKTGVMGSADSKSFIWDGANIVAEVDGNGNISTKYLRGINLIARETPAFGQEYYLFNAHGDVTGLTDASGNLIKSYDYDAWGVEKNPDPNDTNVFRYCGEMFDKDTGTYYLRNRHMNPKIGRFTQEDPARSGLNWYTYASNNPILFIDPMGLAIQLQGTDEERQRILDQMRKLTDGEIKMNKYGYLRLTVGEDSKTTKGNELIQRLIGSKYTNKFFENTQNDGNSLAVSIDKFGKLMDADAYMAKGSSAALINFDTQNDGTLLLVNPETGFVEEQSAGAHMLLAHELIHADRMNRGVFYADTKTARNNVRFGAWIGYNVGTEHVRREELATVGLSHYNGNDITENMLRQEHGLSLRGAYNPTFSVLKNSLYYQQGWKLW